MPNNDLEKITDDPFVHFRIWFEEAMHLDFPEPTAMALATVGINAKPSLRMVLLKQFDKNGFVFFTNYNSRKGQNLLENPAAAVVIWWDKLKRQVRVEGKVEKVSDQESDNYYQSRPRENQISAWASPQSEVIDGYDAILDKFDFYQNKFSGKKVPRPPHWGGFRLKPELIEFWQGKENRLHQRVRFKLNRDGSWKKEWLAP